MTISHLEEMPTMPRSTSNNDTKGIKLINRMYKSWKQDPKSVHISWAAYFGGLDKGMQSKDAFSPPPSLSGSMPVPADGSPQLAVEGDKDVTDYLKVRHRTIFPFYK
jgi:2-oxoglutarate dehydrogenase complex dehydrogenase (E1) component-like enzyme